MELEEPSKETTEESTVPAEPQLPSEFEKLFKGCEENPDDFNGWVYLLQYVEQEVRENTQIIQICAEKTTEPKEVKLSHHDLFGPHSNWIIILKENSNTLNLFAVSPHFAECPYSCETVI